MEAGSISRAGYSPLAGALATPISASRQARTVARTPGGKYTAYGAASSNTLSRDPSELHCRIASLDIHRAGQHDDTHLARRLEHMHDFIRAQPVRGESHIPPARRLRRHPRDCLALALRLHQ